MALFISFIYCSTVYPVISELSSNTKDISFKGDSKFGSMHFNST